MAAAVDEAGQLSFRDALMPEPPDTHVHADAVTVTTRGTVDPDALLDLLENPPAGVYRMKGVIAVRQRSATRTYVVNVVGPSIDIARGALSGPPCLVAIGMHLDTDAVRRRLTEALQPAEGPASPASTRRLSRYVTKA